MMAEVEWTVENLFSGKSVHLGFYHGIRKSIEAAGPVRIEIAKTQVAFVNRRQFAWVWLPMEWDRKRPPNSVVLSFALAEQLSDPRIVDTVEPYPGRWMHHVIITADTDLDDTVCAWLKAAYDFGG